MARISKAGFLIADDERLDLKRCYRIRLVGNAIHVNHAPSEGCYAVDIFPIDGDAQNQWNEAFKPHDHTK